MTEYRFETHEPVRLYTEIGKGSVKATAIDTTETHVQVTGRDADQVVVRQEGRQVSVIGPKQRSLISFGGDALDVLITVPTGSEATVKTGSADVTLNGTFGTTQLKSGSGDIEVDTIEGPLLAETGSGDVRVESAQGDLKAKSGSGDIIVVEADRAVTVSTGSGDVQLWTTHGPAVVKTGSGDLKVGDAGTDLSFSTGSGDVVVKSAQRGRLTAKSASGDLHIGVRAGVPVWTEISTVSGQIRSNLQGAGEPRDGADHLELRARTVSGDVVLTEV